MEMDANGQADTELVATRKNSASVTWRYLGFKLSDSEHREVLCKTCKVKVAATHRNTIHFYQHLQQHREKYDECLTVKVLDGKEIAEAAYKLNSTISDVFASPHGDRKKSQTP